MFEHGIFVIFLLRGKMGPKFFLLLLFQSISASITALLGDGLDLRDPNFHSLRRGKRKVWQIKYWDSGRKMESGRDWVSP